MLNWGVNVSIKLIKKVGKRIGKEDYKGIYKIKSIKKRLN